MEVINLLMLFNSSPLSPLTIFLANQYAQTCRMILIIVFHSIIRRLYLAPSVNAYFPIAYIMNYRENRLELPILRMRIKRTIHDHYAPLKRDARFQERNNVFIMSFFILADYETKKKRNEKVLNFGLERILQIKRTDLEPR